jgi:hypothetical protein
MKTIKLMVGIFFLLSGWLAFSQNTEGDDQMRTLFNNGSRSLGGYGGITARYNELGSAPGAVVGFRGCFIAGHTVAIGFGGNGIFSNFKYDSKLGKDALMAGGYGGLFVEPIILPKLPVHIALPVMIGVGGISYSLNNTDKNWRSNYSEDNVIDSKAFFLIEPGVELEINVVKYLRLAVGAYYRFTSDVSLQYSDLTPIEKPGFLRGISTGITLKFGKF